jgi:hypothetical protein
MARRRFAISQWTLNGNGSLPRCHAQAPPPLKLALVLLFRHRWTDHLQVAPDGFVALFVPTLAVVLAWLALVAPACFTLAKNFTATICATCAGLLLATAYLGAIVVAAVFVPSVALFCAGYLATHAAWFLAHVHEDAVHGTHWVANTMHVALAVVAATFAALPATVHHTPDIAYVVLMWLPEAINWCVYNGFQAVAASYLSDSTCWCFVGEKNE